MGCWTFCTMLKCKRTFDVLDSTEPDPPIKRPRFVPPKSPKTVPQNPASRFQPSSPYKATLLTQYIEHKLRINAEKYTNNDTKDFIFTLSNLQDIVQKAVEERETELREEYDTILANRLADQYHAFVRFNEELISRRFQDSDCSYVS